MREELEGLINEKLNGIDVSLEDMYTPYDEEIKEEIKNQNKKAEEELQNKEAKDTSPKQEEKDVE